MRTARVVVVIPAGSCACQQSAEVVRQMREDDCLVIVQNGGSVNHLCAAHSNDERVIHIRHLEPLSPAIARNTGAAVVAATVFAFTDADDHVAPHWLDRLCSPLLVGSADLAAGALLIQHQEGFRHVLPEHDYWYRQSAFGSNVAVSAMAWGRLGGFNAGIRYGEDTDLAWRAGEMGMRVTVVPDAAVEVTLRPIRLELRQRFQWGWASVNLLVRHSLTSSHYPTWRQLIDHKRTTGYGRAPTAAATAQWFGQSVGRFIGPLESRSTSP